MHKAGGGKHSIWMNGDEGSGLLREIKDAAQWQC